MGSHVALACNFGLQKATSSFFLVNLTYKFNKTAETTQYKFSKKKELTIMYPKFHKDNFIRSTFVTSQLPLFFFSHSGLNFKRIWDIFSTWSSQYGLQNYLGLDKSCPPENLFKIWTEHSNFPVKSCNLLKQLPRLGTFKLGIPNNKPNFVRC